MVVGVCVRLLRQSVFYDYPKVSKCAQNEIGIITFGL